jgi:hypothetical protein
MINFRTLLERTSRELHPVYDVLKKYGFKYTESTNHGSFHKYTHPVHGTKVHWIENDGDWRHIEQNGNFANSDYSGTDQHEHARRLDFYLKVRYNTQETKCPDCKGKKLYYPLVGPAENCTRCSGTGLINEEKENKKRRFYKILGNFQPSGEASLKHKETFDREIREFLKQKGYQAEISGRQLQDPDKTKSLLPYSLKYHSDFSNKRVFWSNNTPTRLRKAEENEGTFKNGKLENNASQLGKELFPGKVVGGDIKDGDVILIHDRKILHAIPPDSKKDRYLYTASVEKIRRKNKLSESEEDDEFLKDNKIHPIDLPAEADYCDYGHQATSYRLAHSKDPHHGASFLCKDHWKKEMKYRAEQNKKNKNNMAEIEPWPGYLDESRAERNEKNPFRRGLNRPYRRLGKFYPSNYDSDTIHKEFTQFIQDHNYELFNKNKHAVSNVMKAPEYGLGGLWHQDKEFYDADPYSKNKVNLHNIIWVSNKPTKIRNKYGKMVGGDIEPNDVVALLDRKSTHAAPAVTLADNRWFASYWARKKGKRKLNEDESAFRKVRKKPYRILGQMHPKEYSEHEIMNSFKEFLSQTNYVPKKDNQHITIRNPEENIDTKYRNPFINKYHFDDKLRPKSRKVNGKLVSTGTSGSTKNINPGFGFMPGPMNIPPD